MINLITDISHYDIVLNLITLAKQSVWMGMADIKDLYVKKGNVEMPFLSDCLIFQQ